jgi:hypothetical protein
MVAAQQGNRQMTEIEMPIHDMDEWAEFWAANAEALEMDEDAAITKACQGGLVIGGGAAPLFHIYFVA